MGIIRRLLVLWRSYREQHVDAESMLEDALERVDERLAEMRSQLASCAWEEHRLAALVAEEEEQAQRMLDCARQALRLGKEPLAREAVVRQLRANRQARRYQQIRDQQRLGTMRLQNIVEELEAKRMEAEFRRQQLAMRGQFSHARRTLVESLYGERGRLQVEFAEEKIFNDELSADAYQELVANPRLLALDEAAIDPVEETLAVLRAEVQTSSGIHTESPGALE